MPSKPTIDFDALLTPISEEAPSGESLREHPELSREFYAVREARNAAMEAERVLARLALMEDGDFERDPSGRQEESRQLPDWAQVIDRASDLLCHHSKDLWIVSWLIEGLTRQEGLAGFRDGLKLCRQLSERFWDSVHPRPEEEDGYAYTVAQLAGLDNTLSSALDETMILPPDPRFTWANYELALSMEQMDAERQAERLDDGAVSLQAFQTALRNAGRDELLSTKEDLAEALSECKLFSETMHRLCGKDASGFPLAPPTINLERTLERLKHLFAEMTQGLLADKTEDIDGSVAGELTTAGGNSSESGANLMQRPVASRNEALHHLLRVADFFRKSEPHSPVSYALEQAVRWGRMPLPELLRDLVSDDEVLAQVFKRMGIVKPDDSSGD